MVRAQEPGDIEWNFTKFLIDRNGNIVKRFHPTTTPEAIDVEIGTLLTKRRNDDILLKRCATAH